MRRRAPVLAVVAALELLAAPPRARGDEAGERAEALMLGAAINRFVARQLPVSFEVAGDGSAGTAPFAVTLVEARHCGAIDAGHGRLIGVVRPAGQSVAPPLLTGARDCLDKLDDLARRLAPGAGGDALAVVEILVAWAPWQLRFSIGNLVTGGDGSAALGLALARARAAGPIATLDTAAIRLGTERGASLSLDLALSFLKAGDAVLSTLTPAGQGDGREPRPSLLEQAGAPAAADAIAGATFPFANRVVALLAQDGPLVLEFERRAVEIRALQLGGGNNLLTIRGRATPRAVSESVRLAIDSTGPDLKVAAVRADPELEDCGALSVVAALGCKVRNSARAAAAAALATGMTGRYRDQLLRTLMAPPPFSFEVAGRRSTLRLTPLRVRATGAALVVYGKGELE